ncbi:hypothetical protein EYZ11_004123 [Aspergillus tanneri]|uniref:Uncharacterized protein n=1 Tax=Aspergillus tanneri TaxID=1220188 RepID=A0A4S3JLB1_9EURO|nr:hypothetical protein EYZ11_004123 [Aspergillus tanneri]
MWVLMVYVNYSRTNFSNSRHRKSAKCIDRLYPRRVGGSGAGSPRIRKALD